MFSNLYSTPSAPQSPLSGYSGTRGATGPTGFSGTPGNVQTSLGNAGNQKNPVGGQPMLGSQGGAGGGGTDASGAGYVGNFNRAPVFVHSGIGGSGVPGVAIVGCMNNFELNAYFPVADGSYTPPPLPGPAKQLGFPPTTPGTNPVQNPPNDQPFTQIQSCQNNS